MRWSAVTFEVGVFYEEGPWFDHAKSIGDSLQEDIDSGTEVKYTFANTASDSARNLRWQNGDPLDVDTGRWSSQGADSLGLGQQRIRPGSHQLRRSAAGER